VTSQSPGVSETLVALKFVPDVTDVPVDVFVRISPTLPALALLLAVVPTMPAVCEGVIAPVALSVVNAPLLAAVPPIAGGDAQIVVLHVKPVPLVYCRMLDEVLQLGIAKAVGLALDPVAFASTVFAAIAAIPLTPTPPHAGALLAPVETIACPELEPVGFRSWTGTRVAPKATDAKSAMNRAKTRFMDIP
jgi:hypothetical protein